MILTLKKRNLTVKSFYFKKILSISDVILIAVHLNNQTKNG